MKSITKTLLVTAILFCGFGKAKAQAVEEGNFLVDAYYSFPNLFTAIVKSAANTSGEDVDVSSYGPVGVRFEYLLSDKFGMGLDFHLTHTGLNYSEIDSTGTGNLYNYEVKSTRFVGLLTFNYHFYQTDKLDLYGMAGAGYRNRNFISTSNDPNYVDDITFKTLIPVGARIAFGMRYFFTDNIGANAAIGIGGPLISFGISGRL